MNIEERFDEEFIALFNIRPFHKEKEKILAFIKKEQVELVRELAKDIKGVFAELIMVGYYQGRKGNVGTDAIAKQALARAEEQLLDIAKSRGIKL